MVVSCVCLKQCFFLSLCKFDNCTCPILKESDFDYLRFKKIFISIQGSLTLLGIIFWFNCIQFLMNKNNTFFLYIGIFEQWKIPAW